MYRGKWAGYRAVAIVRGIHKPTINIGNRVVLIFQIFRSYGAVHRNLYKYFVSAKAPTFSLYVTWHNTYTHCQIKFQVKIVKSLL